MTGDLVYVDRQARTPAAAILIAILGGIVIARMPTDVLPDINIPVVSAIWQYRGLAPEEMERRITMQRTRSPSSACCAHRR